MTGLAFKVLGYGISRFRAQLNPKPLHPKPLNRPCSGFRTLNTKVHHFGQGFSRRILSLEWQRKVAGSCIAGSRVDMAGSTFMVFTSIPYGIPLEGDLA